MNHGDFPGSIRAINTHVTGHVADFVIELRERVENLFNSVSSQLDLRHAISYFSQQQIILDKVDSVSHKYSDPEARNFLLRALRKPSVRLQDVYRSARTAGDDKFDTYEKLKDFLTSVALPREADRSGASSSRNGLLDAASAKQPRQNYSRNSSVRYSDRPRTDQRNVSPFTDRRDQFVGAKNHNSRFRQQPRDRNPQPRDASSTNVACFKCGRLFNTTYDAVYHARNECSALVSCTVPNCPNAHSHKTMFHRSWEMLRNRYNERSNDNSGRRTDNRRYDGRRADNRRSDTRHSDVAYEHYGHPSARGNRTNRTQPNNRRRGQNHNSTFSAEKEDQPRQLNNQAEQVRLEQTLSCAAFHLDSSPPRTAFEDTFLLNSQLDFSLARPLSSDYDDMPDLISDSDSFTDESDNDSESSSLCGDHPDDEADNFIQEPTRDDPTGTLNLMGYYDVSSYVFPNSRPRLAAAEIDVGNQVDTSLVCSTPGGVVDEFLPDVDSYGDTHCSAVPTDNFVENASIMPDDYYDFIMKNSDALETATARSSSVSVPKPDPSTITPEKPLINNFSPGNMVATATHSSRNFCCGLDTMAYNHLVGDPDLLTEIRLVPRNDNFATVTADGTIHHPKFIGTLPVIFNDVNGNPVLLRIRNVLAIESWPTHRILLSVGQWEQQRDESGSRVFYKTDDNLTFFSKNPNTHRREKVNLPYERNRLHTITPVAIGPAAISAARKQSLQNIVAATTPSRPSKITSELAHIRFGFVNPRYVKSTIDQGRGLELTDDPNKLPLPVTEASLHGMSRRQPLIHASSDPSNSIRRNWSDHEIKRLSMDMHGPFISAINGAKYYTSFTSDDSMFYPFFHKEADSATLMNAVKSACLELGTPKEIRMDRSQTLVQNDPSFLTEFQQFCLDKSIALKISPPNHQEMNAIAEKSGGRDVYEHATALLHHAGVSTRFWPFAVQHYADTYNSVPRPSTDNKSPYEKHYGIKPYIGHYRVCCCPAFLHKDKKARGTTAAFSSRVDRCIHLGIARDSPPGTYLLYKLSTRQIVVSRDVIFDEHFRFVTRTSEGWVFQESRLDNEYDTQLGHPVGLELVRTDDVVHDDANRSSSPSSTSINTTSSPLATDSKITLRSTTQATRPSINMPQAVDSTAATKRTSSPYSLQKALKNLPPGSPLLKAMDTIRNISETRNKTASLSSPSSSAREPSAGLKSRSRLHQRRLGSHLQSRAPCWMRLLRRSPLMHAHRLLLATRRRLNRRRRLHRVFASFAHTLARSGRNVTRPFRPSQKNMGMNQLVRPYTAKCVELSTPKFSLSPCSCRSVKAPLPR